MAVTHPDAIRNSIAEFVTDQLDNGTLEFFTAGFAAEVAVLPLSVVAFFPAATNGASVGDIKAQPITSDTTAIAGLTTVARFKANGGAIIIECSVGTAGEDINLSSNNIAEGDTVAVSDIVYSAPA